MDEMDARGEPVVTATGGVTLQKRLETEDVHQPTVLYELGSQRDTAVDVRIVEPIPSALEPADLGFLETAGEQPWEINGPKLVFERTLEPDESSRSGIAARGDRADAIADLLEPPEFVDVDEANGRVDGETESARHGGDAAGRLVEQLVAELREGTVPAETVASLRAELAVAPERPSLETRLAQLQADVADVRAYANAMEGFLDEHGSADAVVERFENRLDEFDERLGAIETELAARSGDVTAVEERVAGVESRVDTLERVVDRVEGRLPESDVDERLEAVESELATVSAFTSDLKAAFRE
jgi:hypothetical protein